MDDETLAITLLILVDEWYQREGAQMIASRPGPKPQCTDSEILVLSLLRLLIMPGCSERRFLRWMRTNHPDWFPDLPDDGNFNRRARSLLPLLNASLRYLTADVDTLVALLDTSGLSVVKLARATRRQLFREDDVFPAGRGFSVTTKAVYYGYKLVLLCTMEGLPFRVALVPANLSDQRRLPWMLEHEVPGWRLADKGFWSQELIERLKARGQYLLIPPKQNSPRRWDKAFWRTLNRIRRRIETTLSVLKDYFLLEFHRARTFGGLAWRVLLTIIAFLMRRKYALGV
jgi:hypothetical protein